MREALSKLIANMVYLGATEEEIMKAIRMSKELIDFERKYSDHSGEHMLYKNDSPWLNITTATNNTN